MKTLDQILEALPEERREQIAARSEELILEEHALRRMRKARKLTQERMAELLNVRQDSISRLERRSDLLLSTLRSYVEAMGGTLQLMVKFDDERTVALPSLAEADERAPVTLCTSVLTGWDRLIAHELGHWVYDNANTNCVVTVPLMPVPVPATPSPEPHTCRHALTALGAFFSPMIVYRYDPPHQRSTLGCDGAPWQGEKVCW